MLNSSIIQYPPFYLLLSSLLIFLVMLLLVVWGMKTLLKKCNESYEEYETHTVNSFAEFIPIPKLLFRLAFKPRMTIKEGNITCYNDESYQIWLYAGASSIGVFLVLLQIGSRSITSLIGMAIGQVIGQLIGIAIGKWFYIGWGTLMFRYVGGIKLSYEEGQSVFSPLFMLQYIISIVLNVIVYLIRLASGMDALTFSLSGYRYLGVLTAIFIIVWGAIMNCLLMKYRYGLSTSESIIKQILFFLVQIGMFVAFVLVMIIPVLIFI